MQLRAAASSQAPPRAPRFRAVRSRSSCRRMRSPRSSSAREKDISERGHRRSGNPAADGLRNIVLARNRAQPAVARSRQNHPSPRGSSPGAASAEYIRPAPDHILRASQAGSKHREPIASSRSLRQCEHHQRRTAAERRRLRPQIRECPARRAIPSPIGVATYWRPFTL